MTEPYTARFGAEVVDGRKLDLWRAVELALNEAGVMEVERTDLCTFCHPSSSSPTGATAGSRGARE